MSAVRALLPLLWGCMPAWLGRCIAESAVDGAPVAAAVFVAGSVLTVSGYLQTGRTGRCLRTHGSVPA